MFESIAFVVFLGLCFMLGAGIQTFRRECRAIRISWWLARRKTGGVS